MNFFIKTFIPFLLSFLLLPLSACALSSGPVEGKVLEEGTNKPIAGAIIIVRWEGHVGYTGTVCYHVESAITDEHGVYRTAAWKKPSPYGDINYRRQNILAYKLGYEWSSVLPKDPTVLQYLKPFTGGRGERLEYLRRSAVSCHQAGESKKNLLPLVKALYEEALNLAKTEGDKKTVNNLLFNLEIIELGYEAAERRDIERSRGQK